jgi:hypothetical protein
MQMMESKMTKMLLLLCTTAAVAAGGALILKAEATPLAGATSSFAVINSYSTAQKVGCMFGTHRCPAGTKWLVLSIRVQPGKPVFAGLAS